MRHALTILLLSASVVFGQTLTNTTLDGVTNTTLNGVLDNDASATRTAIGLGTAATADKSTTGGADKIPQFDGSGDLKIGPTNATNEWSATGGNLRIPDRQLIQWENSSGAVAANLWLYGNHSGGAEWLLTTPRACVYWDHGFQLGQAGTARSKQFLYFQSLGAADVGDPVREGVPVMWDGEAWIGGARTQTNVALQFIPSSTVAQEGEMQFSFFASGYVPYDYGGRISGTPGVNQPLSIAHDGLRLKSGGIITFADATTLSSTGDIQDMIDTSLVQRTGFVELVAGEATVVAASVTGFTEIIVSHKVAAGTLGHLSTVKDAGVGFDIISTSATDTSTVSYLLVEGTVSDVAAPTISGTTEISDTLTVSGGAGAIQWYSGASPVSGETAITYVLRPADIGAAITCQKSGVASNAITAWHPDDESGYYADYRNDVDLYQTSGGSAATAHADPVGSWKNQAGNYAHIEQSTSGYRPTLDTTTYGAYPHVRFDGTDDFLQSSAFTPTLPQTVFVVAETVAVGASRRLFSIGEAGSRMTLEPVSGDEIQNGAATTSNNNLWPLATRGIVTARATTTELFVRVNAGAEYTAAATPVVGSRVMVGGTAAGNAHNCRVFGVLYYQATLDTDAQTRVRKYLKAKYGTP